MAVGAHSCQKGPHLCCEPGSRIVFRPSPDLCEFHIDVIVSTPDFCIAVNIARHAYNVQFFNCV